MEVNASILYKKTQHLLQGEKSGGEACEKKTMLQVGEHHLEMDWKIFI